MTYEKGLVSVIIPTYKRTDKLLRAVKSVCEQSYKYLEVLVVNDNENDDRYTKALISLMETVTDSRVQLIFQEKHINGAAARNAGIKKARGEYIAFLDDDDYWHIEKIRKQIEAFKTLDESYGAVSTMFKSFLGDKIISKSLPYKDGYIWESILLRRCDVTTCSIMIKHEALDKSGYFDESLARHQEIQLLAYLSHEYKIYLLKEYLVYVDAWGENNPSPERLIKAKKDFYKSVEPLMNQLSDRRKIRIIIMHNFEVAFAFYKQKDMKQCVKYFLPILSSPVTVYYAVERVLLRLKSKRI
ncbi:glycosyltransferase family 2 protein [Wansuia hejianensis]|uniref:Glycosyltransferase family 2 protein n=1 Tax=Wansuia hejianensis TaxID=2763667 RepID=A0A7G9GDB0_9FIRM|nr:glycosyltransferase family 2 protein [Wansuia hejianensis]QNM08792.1 glycosyltransferase family 2 protein [Wansuia hejianensis]